MFPDAVGDLEPQIGAGLCKVVDTDFRAPHLPQVSAANDLAEELGGEVYFDSSFLVAMQPRPAR